MKITKDMMFPKKKKFFARSPCPYCGKMISNCGFAYTKHDEMHQRKGDILKRKEKVEG